MEIVGTWFANKVVQLAVGALAIIGVILIPVTIRQAVEIHGFLWWDGLEQQRDDAYKARDIALGNYSTCKDNRGKLQIAVNSQNIQIAELSELGDQNKAEAAKAVAIANAKAARTQAALDAFKAHKPMGATACERAKDTDDYFLKVIQ